MSNPPTQPDHTWLAATWSGYFDGWMRVSKFKNSMPMGWLWVSYSKTGETQTDRKTSSPATFPARSGDFSNYIKRVLRTTWQKSLQIWWDFRQIWLDLIGYWMDLVRTHRIWRDLANFLWFSASPKTNHHLIFTRTIQLDSLTSWLWVRDLPTQFGRVGWGLSTSSTKTNPWSALIKTSSKKWLF